MLIQGTLMKGYAGFYYVYADDRVWECSLRGRFRVKKQDFIAGDNVMILPVSEAKATIEKVIDRKNSLTRPAVANVDQAILVFALSQPDPDYNLLDRLLVQTGKTGIDRLIVFTKSDLVQHDADQTIDYYRALDYPVLTVSNKTKAGIGAVRTYIQEKVSVLAGPSGTGKSSLLNSLEPGRVLKTGQVSAKIGRGRHTTRHVELISVTGGLVADTPGFSALSLPEMKREELQNYFPEIAERRPGCRFKSCLHDKEPDCTVKEAVKNNEIAVFRYEHYVQFLQEVIEHERRY